MAARVNIFERNRTRLLHNIAGDLLENLVRDTPVDTGLARSNWQPSSVFDLPSPVGINTEEGTIAQGREIIRALEGRTLIISNPIGYIRFLDEGHSPQAMAGYISRAFAKAGVRRLADSQLLEVNYPED